MKSTCTHPHAVVLATHGFTGPVSRNENRAAHGNICDTEECRVCGARRDVNVNQFHVEEGPWGPTREERRLASVEACSRARAAIAAVPALAAEGLRLTLDSEGYILATGRAHLESEVTHLVQEHPTWLAAAQRARRAVIAAERASEVAS